MKKPITFLTLIIILTFSLKAQWQTAPYGISYTGGKVSINTTWSSGANDVNLTVKGALLNYGSGASVFFGGLENTSVGYGEYGIEYNVTSGGLNFWKPDGSNGFKNWVLFLKVDGRVGIGTNSLSDGFKLTVAGGINAQKILITETAGADFVFENEYYLMPIKDLDRFIKSNKHLPDVPSAKEMEENGIDMGEFQILLLQKVEELSLYIIQQQKEIEDLKAHLQQAQ